MDDQKTANSYVTVLQGWSKDRKLLVCISLTRLIKRQKTASMCQFDKDNQKKFVSSFTRKTDYEDSLLQDQINIFNRKKNIEKPYFSFFGPPQSIIDQFSFWSQSIRYRSLLKFLIRLQDGRHKTLVDSFNSEKQKFQFHRFCISCEEINEDRRSIFSPLPFQMMHYLLVSNNPLRNAKCFLC
jgi:hypothetical protein